MCQSLVDWQLGLQVPETGRKPVPPSLERGGGGRPVCSQPSPFLPTSCEGGSWQEEVGRAPGVQPRGFWNLDLQRERNLPWDCSHSSKQILSVLGRRRPSAKVPGMPSNVRKGFVLPFSPTAFRGLLWDAVGCRDSLSVSIKPGRPHCPLEPLGLMLNSRI